MSSQQTPAKQPPCAPISAQEAKKLFAYARNWYKHSNFSHTVLRQLVFGTCTHAYNDNAMQFDTLTVPDASADDLEDYVQLLEQRAKCQGMDAQSKERAFASFMKSRHARRQRLAAAGI